MGQWKRNIVCAEELTPYLLKASVYGPKVLYRPPALLEGHLIHDR